MKTQKASYSYPRAGQLYRVRENPDDERHGGGIAFDHDMDLSDYESGGPYPDNRHRLEPGSIFMLVHVKMVQPVWSRFYETHQMYKIDILYHEKLFKGILMSGDAWAWVKNFERIENGREEDSKIE